MIDRIPSHKGWRLVTEEERDDDGFFRYDHYAVKDGEKRQHLHGSPFLSSFFPDQAIFEYLVDHDFPRAPKGNWFTYELKELIEKGKHNGIPELAGNDTATEEGVVPTEDDGAALLRHLSVSDPETREG